MSKKVQPKKDTEEVVKTSKFKLISYTVKATIPVGQYANICPEVTVEAETIEHAERAVMPHIEAMFAKYRDGGVKPIEPARPVVSIKQTTVAPQVTQEVSNTATVPKPTEEPVVVMTVPFNRAKSALESCTSLAALNLVAAQIEKSTKLVDAEKVQLKSAVAVKLDQLNKAGKTK